MGDSDVGHECTVKTIMKIGILHLAVTLVIRDVYAISKRAEAYTKSPLACDSKQNREKHCGISFGVAYIPKFMKVALFYLSILDAIIHSYHVLAFLLDYFW